MPTSKRSSDLERLREITDRLPDGIITFDSELTVLYFNAAATLMLHPDQLHVGQRLPQIWGTFPLRDYAEKLFTERSVPRLHEVRLDKRIFSVSGLPARKSKTAAVVIEDASARERRAGAEREFVANAAHELLTPLTGIAGAAHVLESGAKDVPEIRDRFLEHITRESARLARIARALLVLARARSGLEPPRPDVVALRELLEDSIETAGNPVADFHCPPSLRVFVDRDLAEQAFSNLIANASRHGGGTPVRISTDEREGYVGIAIADDGPGMQDDQIDRIQRRFATATGRDGTGFGLGLSIAAQAIDAIGGTIEFDSRPGEGTTVRVELPSE